MNLGKFREIESKLNNLSNEFCESFIESREKSMGSGRMDEFQTVGRKQDGWVRTSKRKRRMERNHELVGITVLTTEFANGNGSQHESSGGLIDFSEWMG